MIENGTKVIDCARNETCVVIGSYEDDEIEAYWVRYENGTFNTLDYEEIGIVR